MTTITLDHISKSFQRETVIGVGTADATQAVDNVSLKIISGDVLAVLGPSGCGKSTLLRLIAGLLKPDSGHILYDNVDIEQVPLSERGIGMVFQDNALIPHWEARRSVGFFLSLRRREHEVPERLLRISKITGIGLDQLLARRPSQLSGGEQQRVAIARALARDLRILLFDEPFANIDAKLRTESRGELKRLLNEFPVTAVYVTHDQSEAVALSHRVAVMRAGRLEQVGTYQQLYDNPINVFVATFIGTPTINLFSGKVRGGRWWGENFGGFAIRGDLAEGSAVMLGIRPDGIHLHSKDTAGITPAVVDGVTPFFAERYQLIEVHLAGEHWALTVPYLSSEQRISAGETVYCTLDPTNALYFDGETGHRIG
ncbi:MAG: ABC transporter ATP-binding protein [Burkholderiales bacterium]|nr:ABC transporter ATP-binding protein [Anaerolineae bacterium]